MFVTNTIRDGILIETISSPMSFINPGLYKSMIQMGGAAAFGHGNIIEHEDVTVQKANIVFLKDMVDLLSVKEFDAVFAHEAAHILNGDVFMESPTEGKVKLVNVLEHEKRADAAGAAVHGAEYMLSAIDKMIDFQIRALLKTNNKTILGIFRYLVNRGDMRKRKAALKAMIA